LDNVTHTLTGLMLARAGLDRLSPRGVWILLLSANAPDIDAVTGFGGSLSYLTHHRGITHSLAMAPVVAALCVLALRPGARLPWLRAWLIALAGVLSHLLLDWTNVYGIRLLEPFSHEWLRLDIMHVVDPLIWAVLLLAVAAPALAKLVSSEIGAPAGRGRGWAWFALLTFFAYGAARYPLHQRAVETLDSRVYEGRPAQRVAALPAMINPLRWTGVVEGDSFVIIFDMNLLQEFDPTGGQTFRKPDPSPAIEAARTTPQFQQFLSFSQFPFWRVTPIDTPEGGTRVEACDLRFGTPAAPRFVVTAILDASLGVQKAWFRFGAGAPVPD
jgi:inner membrane protein